MTTSADLSEIDNKLKILVSLTALNVAPDTLSLKERAILLQRAGLTSQEIARLLGTIRNTVSVALSAAKKAGKSKKKASK